MEKLRLLLAHNGPYVPAHDGANKANRCLMEGLAARGHECIALLHVSPPSHPRTTAQFGAEVLRAGGSELVVQDGALTSHLNGVGIRAYEPLGGSSEQRNLFLRDCLLRTTDRFAPDLIISSCSDSGGTFLRAALDSGRPVVHQARCTAMLGVGPAAFAVDWEMGALLRRTHKIIANSRYMQRYLRDFANVGSEVLDLPTYDRPSLVPDRYDHAEYITMVNPCQVKGLPILLEVARRCGHLKFAAVATWGITPDDRAALAQQGNITVLPPSDDINTLLRRTRVLLVPSLWHEAFGRIVVEALLSGVPVLSSDSGGLPEAKLGVPPAPIPVRPIERYDAVFDERGVPRVRVPEQDIDPWVDALIRLVSERPWYEHVAQRSHAAAIEYVDSLSIEKAERLLLSCQGARTGDVRTGEQDLHDLLLRLSPARRSYLLHLLGRAEAAVEAG